MASVRVSLDGVGAASKIHEREARDLVLGQVKRGQLPLDATPLSFRNDREIVLAAIAIDGAALEHASIDLQARKRNDSKSKPASIQPRTSPEKFAV